MNVTISEYVGDGTAWDKYVLSHASATNYHLYGWRSVIEKSFGHKTLYLATIDAEQNICGLLPIAYVTSHLFGKHLVSLPFVNYGGVVSNDDLIAESLLNRAYQILRQFNADDLELRHLDRFISGKNLETKQHKVTMILDLKGSGDEQWLALDAKVRNQVRKAEKCGLSTASGHLDLLDGFYEVFCRNMRDLGTPVYSKKFFTNILESFPDSTKIISVKHQGRTIASGFLTWFKDTLEVPWASSISDYREMCPNNLLYWEAIKFAIGAGVTKLDFGRSTPGEGTYRFKKQWGAKPVQLYWQYLLNDGVQMPELNTKNPKFEMAIKVWQRLPLWLTNIVGPHLVKNIP